MLGVLLTYLSAGLIVAYVHTTEGISVRLITRIFIEIDKFAPDAIGSPFDIVVARVVGILTMLLYLTCWPILLFVLK